MEQSSHHATLTSPGATDDFAACLGARLLPGDIILLGGPIGGGKTHFARALIQSILTVPEDVPSPTFTLVQTYDTTRGEVWHTDLYRLSHPDDIEELGLPEAMTDAICLIEWPDRLGSLRPDGALSVEFATTEAEDARTLTLTWQHGKWNERLMGCLP